MKNTIFVLASFLVGSLAFADVTAVQGQSAVVCAQALSIRDASSALNQDLERGKVAGYFGRGVIMITEPFAVSAPAISENSRGAYYVCVTVTKQ